MTEGPATIKLIFAGTTPVLDETRFRQPNEREERRAKRAGRNYPRNSEGRWFQWSSAVRAMCVLLVREKARSLSGQGNGQDDDVALKGGKGSLALSLRNARDQNMETRWAADVFGFDAPINRGGNRVDQCRIKTCFDATPCGDGWKVSVNLTALPAENIEILWEGLGIDNIGELLRLANLIEGQPSDTDDPDTGILPAIGVNGRHARAKSGQLSGDQPVASAYSDGDRRTIGIVGHERAERSLRGVVRFKMHSPGAPYNHMTLHVDQPLFKEYPGSWFRATIEDPDTPELFAMLLACRGVESVMRSSSYELLMGKAELVSLSEIKREVSRALAVSTRMKVEEAEAPTRSGSARW